MKNSLWKAALAAGLMLFASLACVFNAGGPAYPPDAIPISTQAAGQQIQDLQIAVATGMLNGQVQLVFNEPGLSSLLFYYLEKQEAPLFTDPQVYLRDGKIQVHGTAQRGNLQAYIYMELTAGVDEQGQLTVDLSAADFGPLPVPDGLREMATAAIREAYLGALGPLATGIRLESITIAEGFMILTGRTR